MQLKVGFRQLGAYLVVIAICFALDYLLGHAASHWF